MPASGPNRFTGGGRSLTLTGLAQTGWLAATGTPDRRYRVAASLEQPAIMDPRTSAVIAPFLEYRDDVHDRSTQTGLNATLIHRMWRIQSVSLDYQIARRRVHEYRFGDLASGQVDLITFLTDAAQGSVGALGSTRGP